MVFSRNDKLEVECYGEKEGVTVLQNVMRAVIYICFTVTHIAWA